MTDPRSNRLRRLLQEDEPDQKRSTTPIASTPGRKYRLFDVSHRQKIPNTL